MGAEAAGRLREVVGPQALGAQVGWAVPVAVVGEKVPTSPSLSRAGGQGPGQCRGKGRWPLSHQCVTLSRKSVRLLRPVSVSLESVCQRLWIFTVKASEMTSYGI